MSIVEDGCPAFRVRDSDFDDDGLHRPSPSTIRTWRIDHHQMLMACLRPGTHQVGDVRSFGRSAHDRPGAGQLVG
jgi:hypothetical protein